MRAKPFLYQQLAKVLARAGRHYCQPTHPKQRAPARVDRERLSEGTCCERFYVLTEFDCLLACEREIRVLFIGPDGQAGKALRRSFLIQMPRTA